MWQEPRGFSGISIGETCLLLKYEGIVGFPIESKQENLPSFRDEVGFLSSYDGNLRNLLSCIKSSLFSSFERELGIALVALQGKMSSRHVEGRNLMVFVELQQEAWCSSRVVTWTSGNLSCCLRAVKSAFKL